MKIKPERPQQGPFGKGGRISQAGSTTQFMMRTMHKINIRDEDPVQALLKYAEEAKNNPQYVDPIYKGKLDSKYQTPSQCLSSQKEMSVLKNYDYSNKEDTRNVNNVGSRSASV